MSNCTCGACGRIVSADTQIEVDMRAYTKRGTHRELTRRYFVCVACYNSLLVCITDEWALRIASQICDSDMHVGQFPPLICAGSYKKSYSDTLLSKILQGSISVLQRLLESRQKFEKDGCRSTSGRIVLPDPRVNDGTTSSGQEVG